MIEKKYKCPKCNYDGKWKNRNSKFMVCFRCGKTWNPKTVENQNKEIHVSVIERVYEKVEF